MNYVTHFYHIIKAILKYFVTLGARFNCFPYLFYLKMAKSFKDAAVFDPSDLNILERKGTNVKHREEEAGEDDENVDAILIDFLK